MITSDCHWWCNLLTYFSTNLINLSFVFQAPAVQRRSSLALTSSCVCGWGSPWRRPLSLTPAPPCSSTPSRARSTSTGSLCHRRGRCCLHLSTDHTQQTCRLVACLVPLFVFCGLFVVVIQTAPAILYFSIWNQSNGHFPSVLILFAAFFFCFHLWQQNDFLFTRGSNRAFITVISCWNGPDMNFKTLGSCLTPVRSERSLFLWRWTHLIGCRGWALRFF